MPNGPFISYAQNAEDVVLGRALGHIVDGRYLDVGAFDPERDSVTRQLYVAGWRGLNLDPVPAYFAALQAGRPGDVNLQVAAGVAAGTLVFHVVRDTGLSTLRDDIALQHAEHGHQVDDLTVQVVTLDALIDEHFPDQDLHILKVDVEGAEADVLAGIDLVRHRPWVLLVEATAPQTTEPTHHDWEPALLARGYVFTLFDGLSRWYVAREHADDLGPALSYPACVLDEYVQVETARSLLRADQAERKAELWRAEALEHALLERRLQIELLDITEEIHEARDAAYQLTLLQAKLDEAHWQAGLTEQEQAWLRGLLDTQQVALEQAQQQRPLGKLGRVPRRAARLLRRLVSSR